MENPKKPRPAARVVNASKKFIIFIGVLSLFAGVIGIFIELPYATVLIGTGIGAFISGGLVAGLSYITQAAELYIEKTHEEWAALSAQEETLAPDESEIQ